MAEEFHERRYGYARADHLACVGVPELVRNDAGGDTGRSTDFVQVEKKPDQIPASIIFFAPGLAGILVQRNWPYRLSLRTLGRSIFERIHHAPGFLLHGNLLGKILIETGFVTYFQFIHLKVRTIQLNR